jgi:autotransporter-associated beta strand protein
MFLFFHTLDLTLTVAPPHEPACLLKNAVGMIAGTKTPVLSCAIVLTLSFGTLSAVYADSATWSTNPISTDWNTAENWTPNTVPNGPDDIATFGFSGHTGVLVSTDIEVSEVIFNAGASPFTINAAGDQELTISGIGITNNSGIPQKFVFPNFAGIVFPNNATAGDMTFFTLKGGRGNKNNGGFASFSDTASAGSGTFVLQPIETPYANLGGVVSFNGNSSAGNGSFMVQATCLLTFEGNSSAANGTFIIDGGHIYFGLVSTETATAGNGLFIINSGAVHFIEGSSAGNATLIANPGTNGGEGGRISFENGAHDGGEARMELFGNGTLDIQFNFGDFVSVGSIEGDGFIELGTNQLITGANNLSTTFSGVIEEPGSLAKIGTGTLTLSGANTYASGTTIEDGTLLVANRGESATGSGPVSVTSGTLGGSGIIAGATTIGTGSGTGAFLAPGGMNVSSTLKIQSALIFNADATYSYTFKSNSHGIRADMVVANGVTISGGATVALRGQTTGQLTQGVVLTLIKNTAAIPIAGTFTNLPDGGIVTINGNNFQASYEGGDGNDLTLTVVP